jgi:hypothetical protein
MSGGSPANPPLSMHRLTRPTMNSSDRAGWADLRGPALRSANGRGNVTGFNSVFVAPICATRGGLDKIAVLSSRRLSRLEAVRAGRRRHTARFVTSRTFRSDVSQSSSDSAIGSASGREVSSHPPDDDERDRRRADRREGDDPQCRRIGCGRRLRRDRHVDTGHVRWSSSLGEHHL